MYNTFLFVAFPYLAVGLAVGVGLYRYFKDRYSFSSQSSQFLESRLLFWGSVPWHYGLIAILLAHVVALIIFRPWAALLGSPARLYTLEIIGLALAIMAIFGLGMLILRRLLRARVFAVTTRMDWVLLTALLVQLVLGVWVAIGYRWGSEWSLRTAVPWLFSLLKFSPNTSYVMPLPWVVKLHMLGGFLIIGLFPFTRLVHLVTFPITYLWRPYQVVIWNRRRPLPANGIHQNPQSIH